jgi:hypothetical protein
VIEWIYELSTQTSPLLWESVQLVHTLKEFVILHFNEIAMIIVFIFVLFLLFLILLKLVDLKFKSKNNKKILFKDKIKYICKNSLFIIGFGLISYFIDAMLRESYRGLISNLPMYFTLGIIVLIFGVILMIVLKKKNIFNLVKRFLLSFLFFFCLRNTLLLLALFIGLYINQACGNILWLGLTNNIFRIIFLEFFYCMCLMHFCPDSNFLISLFKSKDIEVSNIIVEEDITSKYNAAFTLTIQSWYEQDPSSFSNIMNKLKEIHHMPIDETHAQLLVWFNQSADFKKNYWDWVCLGYSGDKRVLFAVPYDQVDCTMGDSRVDVYRRLEVNNDKQAVLDKHNIGQSDLDDHSGRYVLMKKKVPTPGKLVWDYHLYQRIEGVATCYFTLDEWKQNHLFYIKHQSDGFFVYTPCKPQYQAKNLYLRDLSVLDPQDKKAFIETSLITPRTYSLKEQNEGIKGVQVFTSYQGEVINALVRYKLTKLPKIKF